MGFANRAIVAAGLGFAVSALVGCGGSGSLLSGDQANRLSNQLEQASQDLAAYQCRDAARDITNFRSSVDSLNSVNATLVRNLDQGASTIEDLAHSECPVETQTTTRTRSTPTKTTTTNTNKSLTTTTSTTDTATDTITTQTQTEPTTTVITITTPTDTTGTGTGTGTDTTGSTTTGTDTTPSGGTGVGGGTTTTSTISTGVGDGAQGTG